jgi:hypothetical protein
MIGGNHGQKNMFSSLLTVISTHFSVINNTYLVTTGKKSSSRNAPFSDNNLFKRKNFFDIQRL